MRPNYILGISAFFHDSAAALLKDGEIVAAAQEERFTRKKADEGFPRHAVSFCLDRAGIGVDDLTYVVFYDKPLLKFERILETYLSVAPRGLGSFSLAGPLWIKEKLFTDRQIRSALGGYDGELLYAEHHESHAASAYFPSPYDTAAVLTVDGVGEWATSSIGIGNGNAISLLKELRWPDSLGLLYSAFTYYTGFKVNSGEYKVMGLAPYGEPTYVQTILDNLIDLKADGSFRIDQSYFNYLTGLTMTSNKFHQLFGGPPRRPESRLSQREMDLARSIQVVTEEVMLRMAAYAKRETGCSNLCLAGGVALNCVANGRILRESGYDSIWIQPAAGDAGGALGAALMAWHRHLGQPRVTVSGTDSMKGSYLGPAFSERQIESALDAAGAVYHRLEFSEVIETTVDALETEQVVGWFSGAMEFGPRSLGARSILGDPRSPKMQAQMNLKIKFRESFRPFAPSVLRERVADYFSLDSDSPYMLLVAPVREERRIPEPEVGSSLWGIDKLNLARSDIPAVTHVDHSARVQTVSLESNPDYYALLSAFEKRTGCAVLVNTSFNVRGEPIVCSPADAYRCFMRTNMDLLVVGSFVMKKSDQPNVEDDGAWKEEFQLD